MGIKFQRHTSGTGNFESFVLKMAFYFVKRRAILFIPINIVISNTPNDVIDWLNLTSWS